MSEAIDALGEELAVNNHVYLGKGGHVITFPINKGKTFNGELPNTPPMVFRKLVSQGY